MVIEGVVGVGPGVEDYRGAGVNRCCCYVSESLWLEIKDSGTASYAFKKGLRGL